MSIKATLSTFVSGVLCCVATTGYSQSVVEKLGTAVADGTTKISMRYRTENVEQDNPLKDATASTLRTRATWSSAKIGNFSALLEVDNITTIGPDHYDSLITDKYRGSYSVIADPVGTEVNQALLKYEIDTKQSLTFGMQRINHGEQRFVGSVGWRQNEQTMDALSFQRRSDNLDLDYSYIWNVNRIFGTSKNSVQRTNLDNDSHIGLANYKTDAGNFGAYFYALDFEDASALSSITYGLSYAKNINDFSFNASVARQSDYGDNSSSYNSNYLSADLAYNFGAATFTLGYELLGSDDGVAAFMTPLATLHKWQGWTDLFLSTPAGGIEDGYVTVSGKIGKAALSATYHELSADEGSATFGSEWDLVASYPLNSKLAAQLKYASYDRDSFAVDTDKIWLSLNLAF